MVGARRTSVRLEPVLWDALADIAQQRQLTVTQLVTQIDRKRGSLGLTAAIRVYIVRFYQAAATASSSGSKSEQSVSSGQYWTGG
jgi:predicted DNA-binding ribbon-helix-helix protein